jgi:hypothetical protein
LARESVFDKVLQETTGSHETRAPLLRKIESETGRRVISFFTSFAHRDGTISDGDVDIIVDTISVDPDVKPITLILSSPGGYGLAAERIVHACRTASGNDFEVIVPGRAKSAATIICFGANQILMTPTAELGPVDPQVFDPELGSWIPAHVYVRTYEDLMRQANATKGRLDPFLQQLSHFNAKFVAYLKAEISLSDKIARQLLSNGMLNGKAKPVVDKCLKPFLEPEVTGSHGRAIFPDSAQQYGLKISKVTRQSAIWPYVWEYYWRAAHLTSTRALKLIETDERSMAIPMGE